MWNYMTPKAHDEFLLSLNLVKETDVKKVKKILYTLSNNVVKNYKEFTIKKRSGKRRKICEPSKALKHVQRNILRNVLAERKISNHAKAYKTGVSLRDNALEHVGKKLVLKLDIKDFFNSISFTKVYESCFPITMYPKDIGMLLTNLCTYEETLPQGAPTSAFISNLVMRGFDEEVGNYCKRRSISYTRYSDDMTFSGDFNPGEMINYVSVKLKEMGFMLNRGKIAVISRKGSQRVTGLVVNERVQVPKNIRRKIRQEIYYIQKYGLDEHLKSVNLVNKNKYLTSLLGRINFVLQINKEDKEFNKYYKTIYNLIMTGRKNEIR